VEGVQILRGVEDKKAYRLGMNNSATARGLIQMMKSIAERKAVSPEVSDKMIQILLQQEFNEGIPARLPQSVKVAHKTGSINGIYHDFGIVYPEGRKAYLLAVLTRGFENESEAHKCVAEISSNIYGQIL
jgi:beta-lactamase class A